MTRPGRWAAAALATLAAACDGSGAAAPSRGVLVRTGATASALSIVGTWRRTIWFLDEGNVARSSETTYRFQADGTVLRVHVSRNFTFGLVDALSAAGQYRVTGATVIIDYLTPSAFRLELPVRRVGDRLELAGQEYLAVPAS